MSIIIIFQFLLKKAKITKDILDKKALDIIILTITIIKL